MTDYKFTKGMTVIQGASDDKELFDACGMKGYRKTLDENFKNDDSNFRI